MLNIEVDFNALWDFGNPKKTREAFLKKLEASVKKDLDYKLQLKTQVARTHSLVLEFDSAHQILDEVKDALTASTPVASVRYYLERGRCFNSAKEKDLARAEFMQAFELAQKNQLHNYAVDAAHMLAIVGADLEEKKNWSEIGATIARNSNDEKIKRWIGVFYNNLGWDFFDEEYYTDALEYFKKCEEFHRNLENREEQNIARWSIAKAYRMLDQFKKAIKIQEKLLNENGGVDNSGYGYEELGELFLATGEKSKSRNYFKRAYELLSKDTWLAKNEKDRLERMLSLTK